MKSASNESAPLWAPSASLKNLRARADLLGRIRLFFAEREVLEVETPLLSRHATVDRHIESFRCNDGRWLQTSPEFAMKRLLCAGSGPIWQLCKVFRHEESGRWHNPEFSLLEWYRPGYDHHALMDEMEALLAACGVAMPVPCPRLSYREAFQRHAGLDPWTATLAELRVGLEQRGHSLPRNLEPAELADRDFWLDLWMSLVVGPQLGSGQPCFLYDFPASQAALARVRGEVAERFEVFWRGVELANGFHELADAGEQQRRFEADQAWRRDRARAVPDYDAQLIAALRQGLPDCAGVALGVDRLLMLLLEAPELAAVLAFDDARA
jgi:lysyl-tRNA synthetase class 2